jgi:hypothetical protein
MARCRVTVCIVMTLCSCRQRLSFALLCTGVGVVVRSLALKLRPSMQSPMGSQHRTITAISHRMARSLSGWAQCAARYRSSTRQRRSAKRSTLNSDDIT